MPPLFVVDYDALTKIASAFDREADRLRQSFQQIARRDASPAGQRPR